MHTSQKKPNKLLEHERKVRCWTQDQLADALERLCQEELGAKRRKVVTATMISRWERGIHPPNSFYQQMLCKLFEKSAENPRIC